MVVDDLSHSEVRDLDAIFMDEDVLRLDVAMDDVPVLQELQGDDDLGDEATDDLVGKPVLVLEDEVLKRALVAVFYKEEERVRTLLGVDVLQDIGMRDFPQQVDLLKQGVGSDGAGVDRDLLDREDGTFVVLAGEVVAEVDLRHRALAQHRGVVDLVLGHHEELVLCVRSHTLQNYSKTGQWMDAYLL